MRSYERLEGEWEKFCHNSNTVACSSGTAALHLALETLRVTEGWDKLPIDCYSMSPRILEVVVPDFAMIACARAVTLAGMEPRFVDVDELGLINYGVEEPSFKLRIVMPVHTYGRACDTGFTTHQSSISLDDLTPGGVIEDLAEAHGVLPNPESLAACWSFYKNKVIHGEEGGMVAFKTKEQADTAKTLRNMGSTNNNNFWHIPRGMNYRMSNCHAELILESLREYPENINRRKIIESWYDEFLPDEWKLPLREVPWVYDINLPPGVWVNTAVRELNKKGVEARCGFKPLSQQEEYKQFNPKRHLEESGTGILNPVADRISKSRMYLPIYPWMERENIRRNVEELERIVSSFEKAPV